MKPFVGDDFAKKHKVVAFCGALIFILATMASNVSPALASIVSHPIGVTTSKGFILADGKDHIVTTKVHPCKVFSSGCYEIYHVNATLDSTKKHVQAPAGAIQHSVVKPNDTPGGSGYIYTYNSVDVYGNSGLVHLYHTELDTEDYYNSITASNVWERPECTSDTPGVSCGGQSTGSGYDPNTHQLHDWLNGYESGSYPWPFNWSDSTFLTIYVNIIGSVWCSDSDSSDPSNHYFSCS